MCSVNCSVDPEICSVNSSNASCCNVPKCNDLSSFDKNTSSLLEKNVPKYFRSSTHNCYQKKRYCVAKEKNPLNLENDGEFPHLQPRRLNFPEVPDTWTETDGCA
ncbi:hypothetical protein CDAR_36131 [Caerostris darwini]|uniref:Uncharacterized protein n=1 Tax=Caerostris darwini TaxID=1538125 RepID=A0AAV4VBV5_9ARAC|nr:hypothetical protein CDAR_36131 [Caerostris darwini]